MMLLPAAFRRWRTLLLALAAAVLLSWPSPASAFPREFDLTGTLDCDERSGRKCTFVDWANGPALAVFTEDISGVRERHLINASWVRDDMEGFRQDDFVWFTVADLGDGMLTATGVVEYRCADGTVPHGQANQGLSTRDKCVVN